LDALRAQASESSRDAHSINFQSTLQGTPERQQPAPLTESGR
jgi:hypothetical protein